MTRDNRLFTVKKGYPPSEHLLRDLGLSVRFQGRGRATIQAAVVPEVCTEAGAVHLGVLATLVDVLGGFLCMEAFSPDWMATANLSLHTCGTVSTEAGAMSASGRLLRSGRTTATVQAEFFCGHGSLHGRSDPMGVAMTTYARIEGVRAGSWANVRQAQPIDFGHTGGTVGLRQHIIQRSGIQECPETPGGILLNMSGYVRNSFGSLQGGMMALMADVAGTSAARAKSGRGLTTRDLVLHYLSPGRVGPITTRAQVLRSNEASVLSRIEIMDAGDDDRVIAMAMNTCS